MNYEEFLDNYVPELQLLEALDKISQYSEDVAEILSQLASDAKVEKSAEECDRPHPTL